MGLFPKGLFALRRSGSASAREGPQCGCHLAERPPATARVAVALFHFNVQYVAGYCDVYHRYCTQALAPFLNALARNTWWRTSLELSGNGLEFVDRHYPSLIRLLRQLIERGQVELISSTYVPTLWVAFPKRDLVKSIEINRRCLNRLHLGAARVFFAQEAFFGLGVRELAEFFEFAVCKDDYLRHFQGLATLRPIYKLGNMRIVVGSNHLLNELSRRLLKDSDSSRILAAVHR